MLEPIPRIVLPVILGAAWRLRHRTLEASTVRHHVNRAFVTAVAARAMLEGVRSGPSSVAIVAAVVADTLAGLLLWDLARLAFMGPGRRGDRIFQLVACLIATLAVWAGSPGAAPFFLWLALTRHAWLAVLDTGERLRASLLSLAIALAWGFGTDAMRDFPSSVADPERLAWILRSVFVVVAAFGAMRAFQAFTTDPTLGIRRVGHRLLLSHVLVVTVPLLIVIALWISSTYLGVNADRALVAARVLSRETERLEAELSLALRSGLPAGRAASAVVSLNEARWPGARAFSVDRAHVERVQGQPVADEQRLAGWVAGLDSLPAHGVVEWSSQHWVGAAARLGESGAVVLFPARTVLDSTLAPLTGSRVRMPALDRSAVDVDSVLETLADSLVEQHAAAQARDSARLVRARAVTRGLGIPDSLVRLQRRSAPISIEANGDALVAQAGGSGIGFTGQVAVSGVSGSASGWKPESFILRVNTSFHSTLTGLFGKLRENPLQAIPLAALVGLGLLLVPLAHTNLSMVRGMGGSIAQGMAALRDGARAFGAGRLGYRIPLTGDDDLWDTARQFNQMAEGLERAKALEQERARIENELEVARRIQARLLPEGPPSVPGVEVAGLSESAREVGGDYYDHLDLGDGRLLLVVADVSGKGVPAALLMSGFRAALLSQGTAGVPPAEMAARINEFLFRSVEPGRFVTAFLGFLDASSGQFVYVNAGHNPPVLLRASGDVEMLTEGGLILGIRSGTPFTSGETVLAEGDLLALYTDGVTEGADAAGEQWGEARLIALLRSARSERARAITSRIVRAVRSFEGESGPADDITVLVAKKLPAA
jgi:serine phosphatase RsbU (regulator of sigma subunit)